jgi:hypothetical protein
MPPEHNGNTTGPTAQSCCMLAPVRKVTHALLATTHMDCAAGDKRRWSEACLRMMPVSEAVMAS